MSTTKKSNRIELRFPKGNYFGKPLRLQAPRGEAAMMTVRELVVTTLRSLRRVCCYPDADSFALGRGTMWAQTAEVAAPTGAGGQSREGNHGTGSARVGTPANRIPCLLLAGTAAARTEKPCRREGAGTWRPSSSRLVGSLWRSPLSEPRRSPPAERAWAVGSQPQTYNGDDDGLGGEGPELHVVFLAQFFKTNT